MRINLKKTYTASKVVKITKNQVHTEHGLFELLPKDPKIQSGWFRVVESGTGTVVYMTEGRMKSEFSRES